MPISRRLPFVYKRGRTLDFRAAVPDDPAFDVRREGGSTFVFLGLSPDGSVTGLWNDEKILRVWSTVFTNLGVPLAPETPYIPNIDLYDGDAFHNW